MPAYVAGRSQLRTVPTMSPTAVSPSWMRSAEDRPFVGRSTARAAPSTDSPVKAMLLGGEPVGERFIDWNFVSSSKERLAQARADWQAGRMKLPVGDTEEFIPLP